MLTVELQQMLVAGSRAEAEGQPQGRPQVSPGQAAGSSVCACNTDALAISTVVSFWTLFLACIDLNLFLGASLNY